MTLISTANGKARNACVNYFKDWQTLCITYVNATSVAATKNRVDPLTASTLHSCAEFLAIATLAKEYLRPEEYRVLVAPFGEVLFPELLSEETWEAKALPAVGPVWNAVESVARKQEAPKKKSRWQKAKPEEEEDADLGIEVEALMAALSPKKAVIPSGPKIDQATAIAKMVATVKPVEIPIEVEDSLSVKITKSEDGYGLFNAQGDLIIDGFKGPMQALVHANQNKWKILKN